MSVAPQSLNDAWQHTSFVSGLSWEEPTAGVAVKPRTVTCRWGISPHAPYSVRDSLFAKARDLCSAGPYATAIHFAESLAETELLEHHANIMRGTR